MKILTSSFHPAIRLRITDPEFEDIRKRVLVDEVREFLSGIRRLARIDAAVDVLRRAERARARVMRRKA